MSTPQRSVEAGPSRSKPSTPRKSIHASIPSTPAQNNDEGDNPRTDLSATTSTTGGTGGVGGEGDEDGDEERMDIKLIQSFADKIQHLPSTSETDGITTRSKIIIPRRGEKDFEPLSETVNLQEMMLQKSREALFNALVGVRGGNSKSIAHAIVTPSSPYPKMLIIHGHLFDTIGMSIRYPTSSKDQSKGKSKGYSQTELLPEEALYLLERGTLQIWISKDLTEQEKENGWGEWSEEEYGVKGAVEMSVMDGFGMFIGRDGLSWERYQAYAYLKRLGYTVQRTRQFIPDHFLFDPSPFPTSSKESSVDPNELHPGMQPFHTWWLNIPRWITGFFKFIGRSVRNVVGSISAVGLFSDKRFKGTLMEGWNGNSYKSIFQHLRMIPQGHIQPLPIRPSPPNPSASLQSKYDILQHNPYLPFYHIWKPSAPFTKRGWDKGSEQGLKDYPPTYWAGVVESRTTPIPTIHQLDEIFQMVPDEPKGPVKKVGPQYIKPPRPPRPTNPNNNKKSDTPNWTNSYLQAFFQLIGMGKKEDEKPPFVNIPAIRNGDRAFIVAVNDSGNTGWVRFGRSGFAEFAPI